MIVSMSFMAGQTTGPIAIKFTELKAQKLGLGFIHWSYYTWDTINI